MVNEFEFQTSFDNLSVWLVISSNHDYWKIVVIVVSVVKSMQHIDLRKYGFRLPKRQIMLPSKVLRNVFSEVKTSWPLKTKGLYDGIRFYVIIKVFFYIIKFLAKGIWCACRNIIYRHSQYLDHICYSFLWYHIITCERRQYVYISLTNKLKPNESWSI